MAVSSTYGEMQQQIAYELGNRNDLLVIPTGFTVTQSPIQKAIQTAVAKYEREHYYGNEIRQINTFNTVAGQELYTATDCPLLGTSPHIDCIWVYISNNRYALNPRTEDYIVDLSTNPNSQGQPVDYSYYGETLRFYPIPNGVIPVSIEGLQRFSTLTNPGDTNFWMQDAEALIRAEAKADLLRNVLKETDLADEQDQLIWGVGPKIGYADALFGETASRVATRNIKAAYF